MLIRSYRKKPVVVQAVQWDGNDLNASEIVEWINESGGDAQYINVEGLTNSINIATLEGEMMAVKFDWVIRGIAGEFYPCKPNIFFDSYVLA